MQQRKIALYPLYEIQKQGPCSATYPMINEQALANPDLTRKFWQNPGRNCIV